MKFFVAIALLFISSNLADTEVSRKEEFGENVFGEKVSGEKGVTDDLSLCPGSSKIQHHI